MVTYWTKNCSSQGPCRSLDISSLLPIFICSFPILRNPRQLGNLNVTFAITVPFHSTRSQTLCTDAGYQRFFLACGEICRCRSKGDTTRRFWQRSVSLSLSMKTGFTLPKVPWASSPVTRVSRSSLSVKPCEKRGALGGGLVCYTAVFTVVTQRSSS